MASLKYPHKRSPQKAESQKAESPKEGSVAEEKAETPAEASAEGDAPAPSAAQADERMSVFKRHQEARNILHGNERDARRKLDAAHEKELAEMMARHEAMTAPDQPAEG